MKILHLESGRHLYGGARQVGYLINGLAEHGVENLLVCREGHRLAEEANARVFEWRLNGDLDFSLAWRLARLAQIEKPDVVHVHSRRGADSFGGLAARSAGIPAILTRRVQSVEPGFWARWKFRPYESIVAISHSVRDELIDAGIAADRLRLILSAVDTNLFRPDSTARRRLIERYGLPADALIAGTAAQLIRRKGLDLLIALTAMLVESRPNFRLLLFGQGRERQRLERQVKKNGLESKVVFCGFSADIHRMLPGFDLYLHPARREGLGVSVLEAMSAGLPVIASRVGGIVDLIDDAVDGRLVEFGAMDAWYDTVVELLGDAKRRVELGERARRKVEQRFTIERMTSSYLEIYRETVANDGR